ncbi:MAG TPA: acetate--CoA ligase family protein [Casimicrobiaceae bacterium]|nr:acetate--CoA ligase family protein [Casimicrobiaceae bacterium]
MSGVSPARPTSTDAFIDVGPILAPRSIAVIGASDQPGNLGGDTVRRLRTFGFPGEVWPVNRTAATVADLRSYAHVSALPRAAELAIIAVPAGALMNVIRDCVDAGIRHGIAYAGGLADAGAEGAELQRALAALCRDKGFTLCGPNCVGVINATTPVTATFSTALAEMNALRPGVISMVGQSGGIATTAFSIVQQAGFGFRYLVSSGNEAVVSFADYLYAFAQDDGTQIIGGYLEGITDGPKFLRALEAARERGKSIVLIKAGRTGASAQAAQAHTGALVGEDRVFDAVFNEMGVIRVHSVGELVDVTLLLAGNRGRTCSGLGVGVVTFGGGNGVLAADQCALNGLSTPSLSAESTTRLKPLLVSVATAANPVDLTPTTAFRAEALAQLPQALDVIAAEPGIDSLLFIAGALASRGSEISEVLSGFSSRSAKPVCVSWPSPPRGIASRLAEQEIYSFDEAARGITALARLAAHGAAMKLPIPAANIALPAFDWPAFVIADDKPSVITEDRCHRILAAAGLPVAAGELATDEAGALKIAASIGFPVVLKGIGSKVTHRAKAGLLAVDLRSEDEVRGAYRRLNGRAEELGAPLDGIYVQRMQKGGAELLVTAFRDPLFGTMVSCGSGGVLTELIDDVITERAPVSAALAAFMLDRLRSRRHAADAKGPLPPDHIATFVARFSELVSTAPWSRFVFEVNPVLWTRESAIAVDGLLVVG